MGSNTIRPAAAAGYEVITTASAKTFEYVKKLSASQVFDYHSDTIITDLAGALNDKILVGAFDCIGPKSREYCMDVVRRTTRNKFKAITKRGYPPPLEGVTIEPITGVSLKDNEI